MARRRSTVWYVLILGLLFLGCSLSVSEPLPTLVPTAVPIAGQGNLGQPIDTSEPNQTIQAIPTASPTSPPTPTGIAAVETAELSVARATQPPGRDLTTAVFAATDSLGGGTLTKTAVPPTPTIIPTETPTTPFVPTNTATPIPFPRLPDVIWPTVQPLTLPVSNAPRHGVATALGGAPVGTYGSPDYSWTYSWTPFVPPEEKAVQHIPMLAGGPRNGLPTFEQVSEGDANNAHNYWLVFNECEHQGQCNSSPAEAARFFHDEVVDLLYTQGADADAELIIGGGNAHPCGILWLKNFVDYYRVTYGALPVAGWHFHIYPEMHPSRWPDSCEGSWGFNDLLFPSPEAAFNLWREHAYNALAFVQEYGQPGDEIWFTEIGCLNNGFHQVQAPVCQADGFVQAYSNLILNWLNGEGRWVTRYAWYTNWDATYWITTHLIADAPPGERWTYTSLGYWYSQIIPASAVPLPSP